MAILLVVGVILLITTVKSLARYVLKAIPHRKKCQIPPSVI